MAARAVKVETYRLQSRASGLPVCLQAYSSACVSSTALVRASKDHNSKALLKLDVRLKKQEAEAF